MGNPNDSQATTVFILGLLGLLVCQICSPIAWIMGNSYVRQCALEGVQPNGLGVAGRIMGMIGSVLMIISFALVFMIFGIYCLFFVIFIGAAAATN